VLRDAKCSRLVRATRLDLRASTFSSVVIVLVQRTWSEAVLPVPWCYAMRCASVELVARLGRSVRVRDCFFFLFSSALLASTQQLQLTVAN
jgi:hypothetical protein